MKVSGMPIQTPQKQPVGDSAPAQGKNAPSAAKEDDSAVVLQVSQRNSVALGGDSESAEKPGIKDLLNMFKANPESTSQLHAGLNPERVLMLLS